MTTFIHYIHPSPHPCTPSAGGQAGRPGAGGAWQSRQMPRRPRSNTRAAQSQLLLLGVESGARLCRRRCSRQIDFHRTSGPRTCHSLCLCVQVTYANSSKRDRAQHRNSQRRTERETHRRRKQQEHTREGGRGISLFVWLVVLGVGCLVRLARTGKQRLCAISSCGVAADCSSIARSGV